MLEHRASRPVRVARGQVGLSRWELASRPLPVPLQPYVYRLIGYVEQTGAPARQWQFPEPHVVVILEFTPPLRVTFLGEAPRDAGWPGGFVAGLGARAALTEHAGEQRGMQLDLTPAGAARLFGLPMGHVADQVVSLEALLPGPERDLPARLAALPDWAARFDLLEAVLLRRLATPAMVPAATVPAATAAWAVDRIQAHGGALDVSALARELGYSHKHVIALFHEHVGVPPKLYARLVRFQRLMAHAREGGPTRWAELGAAYGYYDQAHLAREVRQLTGMTPTQARAHLTPLAPLFDALG